MVIEVDVRKMNPLTLALSLQGRGAQFFLPLGVADSPGRDS
jgi:hypothetical protein